MRIYRCTVVAYGPTVVDCIVKSRIRDLCVSYIDRGKSMRYVGAGASAGATMAVQMQLQNAMLSHWLFAASPEDLEEDQMRPIGS